MRERSGRTFTVAVLILVSAMTVTYLGFEVPVDEVSVGLLNSFISGVAISLIVWTILIQREELRLQRVEMSRLVALHQRQVQNDLLGHALNDSALAEVWGSTRAIGLEPQQFTYVNMILGHWWAAFVEDLLPEREVERLLVEYMGISPQFRGFWAHPQNAWPEIVDQNPKRSAFVAMAQSAYDLASEAPIGVTSD